MENQPTKPGKQSEPAERPGAEDGIDDTAARAFAPTEIDEQAEVASGWWSEAADGRCSEHAALFAASQPAPLSIV